MSRTYAFFATDAEVVDLWQWMSNLPSVQLMEGDSRPDMPLRRFNSFPIEEWLDPENYVSVVAWPSNVSKQPVERQVNFNNEAKCRLGAVGRTSLTCPAFIRIAGVSAPRHDLVSFRELLYETPFTAKLSHLFSDAQLKDMDWNAFNSVVQRIKKHIERSAATKWRSIPVLPGVVATVRNENMKLWFWGHEGTV